jgi:hypothetical protein
MWVANDAGGTVVRVSTGKRALHFSNNNANAIFPTQTSLANCDPPPHRAPLPIRAILPGKTALVFGQKGDSAGKFKRPSGLAINSMDVVYVSDISTSQLLRIYPDGTVEVVLKKSEVLDTPTGLDVDAYDNVYIASSGKNTILKLMHPKGPLMMVASSTSTPAILAPQALCIDIQDNIYIANGHKDILLLTSKGTTRGWTSTSPL